ncbi:hypothetical protein ACS0TY_010201 [Phlomoides rotata]
MGAASEENAWTIRRILRNMEILSGLKVNFEKCSVLGVNVVNEKLRGIADILGCRVGTIPFLYLGIKVGSNIRRASEWDTIILRIKKSAKKVGMTRKSQ